jgi:hypothetical protein
MEQDWIQLCSCNTIQEAQIIKSLLNDHGITAVLLNKQDSSYLFGEHEIFVSREEVLKAKMILQNSNRQEA